MRGEELERGEEVEDDGDAVGEEGEAEANVHALARFRAPSANLQEGIDGVEVQGAGNERKPNLFEPRRRIYLEGFGPWRKNRDDYELLAARGGEIWG